MHSTLTTLIDRLDRLAESETPILHWGAPVPSFGDITACRVATVGLNPSEREFLDPSGNELRGADRRFHTLSSLGLASWADVDARHLQLILESCRTYFHANPYDTWFKKLDLVVVGTKSSYYDVMSPACHLDLIPYATVQKWTALSARQRSLLLEIAGDTLGLLLRESPVRVLILNGASVVEYFQSISGVTLEMESMVDWSLPRRSGVGVAGFGYVGVIDAISGIPLGRDVLVLGYNHNLQSSFGVTKSVVSAICSWIERCAEDLVS